MIYIPNTLESKYVSKFEIMSLCQGLSVISQGILRGEMLHSAPYGLPILTTALYLQ